MILDGRVEDTQLGAFLAPCGTSEESSEELAGVSPRRCASAEVPSLRVDLDWPELRRQEAPPALVLLAAVPGRPWRRILMHGGGAHTAGRLYSEQLRRRWRSRLPRLAAGRAGPGARPLGVHSARCLDAGANA